MLEFEKVNLILSNEISFFLNNMDLGENGFVGIPAAMPQEDFLKKCVKDMDVEHLPYGRVPQTVFWAKDGECIVGMLKIRHYLNELTLNGGGHFGYYVAKNFRGNGFSKQMIFFAVDWLRKLGENDILVTIYPENIISQKAVIACGFVHDDTIIDSSGHQLMRYWHRI